MRRQEQYAEPGFNPTVAGQKQHNLRVQHNPGMSYFPGRQDALPGEDEQKYMPSKAEGQLQPRGMNQVSHLYNEGYAGDASRSLYQAQRPDSKLGLEKQRNKGPSAQPRENDVEVAYVEASMPQELEALELKFLDEIMKLTKEHQEAEDAEIARHRERIIEINALFQEKLLKNRARQATLGDEYLRHESQARQHQYKQLGLSHFPNMGTIDPYARGPVAAYASDQFDISYKERMQLVGAARNHAFEVEQRGQLPGERAFDSSGRYY